MTCEKHQKQIESQKLVEPICEYCQIEELNRKLKLALDTLSKASLLLNGICLNIKLMGDDAQRYREFREDCAIMLHYHKV